MNKPQSGNPRARLQALLAIPERDRTDEQWDELNELEIMLAAGNRKVEAAFAGRGTPLAARGEGQGQGHGGNKPGAGPGQPQRKPGRKFHKRPRRKGP